MTLLSLWQRTERAPVPALVQGPADCSYQSYVEVSRHVLSCCRGDRGEWRPGPRWTPQKASVSDNRAADLLLLA